MQAGVEVLDVDLLRQLMGETVFVQRCQGERIRREDFGDQDGTPARRLARSILCR